MTRPLASRSTRRNSLSTSKDKLAGVASRPAPTEGSDTSTPAPAVLRVSTPAPLVAPFIVSSPASDLLSPFHPRIISFSSNL